MTRPFLPLVTALMLGISCGRIYRIDNLPVQIALLVTLFLILLFLEFHISWPIRYFLPISMLLLGILSINLYLLPPAARNHISNHVGRDIITIEGMICDNPQVSSDKTDLVISCYRTLHHGQYRPVSGYVLLTIGKTYPFHYGDFIRFHTRLKTPRNYKNPGGFDYATYLRFRGIMVRAFVKDETGFVVLRSQIGNPLRIVLENFRDRIRNTIEQEAPGTEGKIIQAMILGDQKGIPQDVMEKFNRTGTTHIIAISGFNIGIVALFAIFISRFVLQAEYLLLRWNIRIVSTLSAILIVILYAFVAGAGISVLRASIMVTLFLCAILFNRMRDLYNTLSLAAFIILLISPISLFDISFQLSFTAVASLIYFMPKFNDLFFRDITPPQDAVHKGDCCFYVFKVLRGVALFFIASLCATLGTLPLILLYFNRLSIITLVANLLCVPILGIVAIPVSLLIVLTAPVSVVLSGWIIDISELLVRVSLFLIDQFSSLSWASIFVSTPTLGEIVAFYLLLIWLGFLLERFTLPGENTHRPRMSLRYKFIPICLILFFIAEGIFLHLKGAQYGRLTMTALDVGQGSSTLIRFPGGEKMLVDGGGFFDDSFDTGKYIIAPYLWYERITHINTVVLTHPHPDHLQGLLFILKNFHIQEVWINGDVSDSEQYQSFLEIIRRKGIDIRFLTDRSPEMQISGVAIRVLNPVMAMNSIHPDPRPVAKKDMVIPNPSVVPTRKESLGRFGNENDRSLVLQLLFQGRSFLLPADISESVERRLIHAHKDLKSDVLFVPHHGSFHSSSLPFLETVKPDIAVISCGTQTFMHESHNDVLRRYELIGARVFRTDRDGAITITTKGNNIVVSTYESEKL